VRACVEAAGTQFKKGRCNIVPLVPVLRSEVFLNRDQLVKAVIGEHALSVYVSLDPACTPPPAEPTFLQTGKLARLRPQRDGGVRTDFTRISAVVSIEPILVDNNDGECEVRHEVVATHNPFAEVPLANDLLAAFPQLVRLPDGNMAWSDRGA
jgi:hypothetical protein